MKYFILLILNITILLLGCKKEKLNDVFNIKSSYIEYTNILNVINDFIYKYNNKKFDLIIDNSKYNNNKFTIYFFEPYDNVTGDELVNEGLYNFDNQSDNFNKLLEIMFEKNGKIQKIEYVIEDANNININYLKKYWLKIDLNQSDCSEFISGILINDSIKDVYIININSSFEKLLNEKVLMKYYIGFCKKYKKWIILGIDIVNDKLFKSMKINF